MNDSTTDEDSQTSASIGRLHRAMFMAVSGALDPLGIRDSDDRRYRGVPGAQTRLHDSRL